MFIQSNSYCLRETDDNVFSTVFRGDAPISHFASTEDGHVFSSRNELFALKGKNRKKVTNFHTDVTTLSRHGPLVCAGTSDGEVQVFSEHRTSIRKFKDHHAEITGVVIASNMLISSSRDSAINFYDLISGELVHTLKFSKDYVRCMLVCNDALYVFSRDITVISLNDFGRTQLYSHDLIIDAACLIEDGIVAFSCKNRVFIFDVLSKKVVKSKVLHIKEITTIQTHRGKLYTCSLDGHFKTFNGDLRTINDFNLGARLVSFSLVSDMPESTVPYVASEDGRIFSVEREKASTKKSFVDRRRPAYEDEIDFEVVQISKKRLSEIDGMLRRYEYKGALIRCMRGGDNAQKYAVLKHIFEKRVMMRALRDGDTDFVKSVLGLCIETLRIEEFTPIIVEVLFILTSMYDDVLVEDSDAREQLEILSDVINEQVAFEEAYLKTISFVESFPSTLD